MQDKLKKENKELISLYEEATRQFNEFKEKDHSLLEFEFDKIDEFNMQKYVGSREECQYVLNLLDALGRIKYSAYIDDDIYHHMDIPQVIKSNNKFGKADYSLSMIVDKEYRYKHTLDLFEVSMFYQMINEMGMSQFFGFEDECYYALNLMCELYNAKYDFCLFGEKGSGSSLAQRWYLLHENSVCCL